MRTKLKPHSAIIWKSSSRKGFVSSLRNISRRLKPRQRAGGAEDCAGARAASRVRSRRTLWAIDALVGRDAEEILLGPDEEAAFGDGRRGLALFAEGVAGEYLEFGARFQD